MSDSLTLPVMRAENDLPMEFLQLADTLIEDKKIRLNDLEMQVRVIYF